MNHVEHYFNRVALATACGGVWGYFAAMARGHYLFRSARLTALSCGIVSSLCLGIERLVFVGLNNSDMAKEIMTTRQQILLNSHAIGGCIGGGVVGMVYNFRPINGVASCLPFMLLIGYGESKFQDLVDEKRRNAGLLDKNSNNVKTT